MNLSLFLCLESPCHSRHYTRKVHDLCPLLISSVTQFTLLKRYDLALIKLFLQLVTFSESRQFRLRFLFLGRSQNNKSFNQQNIKREISI